MSISASDARSVLHEAHSAWSEGDVEGTLAYYSDDLLYICNKGGSTVRRLQYAARISFEISYCLSWSLWTSAPPFNISSLKDKLEGQ